MKQAVVNKHVTRRALLMSALLALCVFSFAQDKIADNMLLFQRSYGGWPKQFNKKKIDYQTEFSGEQRKEIQSQVNEDDATIDNQATTKEIRYLLKAYKQHNNPSYLAAAEKGIEYLLKAQYANGGWPQFYPDSSNYRGQITFNDNAIANVLQVLQDIVEQKNNLELVKKSFIPRAEKAVERGIDCILKTQFTYNDKPTAWAAQYDQRTLKPAQARKFEPAGLASLESAGIVKFLMRLPNPSPAVINAVDHAILWFNAVAIKDVEGSIIKDSAQPRGVDRVLVPSPGHITWARFYDLETMKPFFSGRDGVKRDRMADIEVERRVGYGWYGDWGEDILKSYPKWRMKQTGEKQ